MVSTSYVEFKPSHREAPKGTKHSPVPASEEIEISIYLKPRAHHADVSREDLATHRAADHKGDIQLVTDFAKHAGLHVVAVEAARRLIRLSGPADKMQVAFKTEVNEYKEGGNAFRGRTGALSLPGNVAEVVESVLGLDTRPAAQPRLVKPHADAASGASYLPHAVTKLYNYPTTVTGKGQCIAIIELGGGYNKADNKAAFAAMGLAEPTIVAVDVDGGKNKPKPTSDADGEVALDIQVAGGAAPGAKLAVYFTPNTDKGFVDAITAAATDTTNKPSVMSISWGGPESTWSAQGLASMTSALQDAANLGLSVFVASGDNLATDGVAGNTADVDFPASSPWAIGCGGTNIQVSGGAISSETVWNDGNSGTGGGISTVYPIPSFQENTKLPVNVSSGKSGRGVPDVCADADPNSGYTIVLAGKKQVIGGTSAVAPLWAGLAALINEAAPKPIGFFLPALYAAKNVTNDITTGNNKPAGSKIGYDAGPGWDACTGLGSPNGKALLALFTVTS